jgi:hypothetical protein
VLGDEEMVYKLAEEEGITEDMVILTETRLLFVGDNGNSVNSVVLSNVSIDVTRGPEKFYVSLSVGGDQFSMIEMPESVLENFIEAYVSVLRESSN